MHQTTTKKISGTPFSITTETIDNHPGTWNSTKVSIFWKDNLIGAYIRNYSAHSAETFYPFLQDGQWYALYSAQYTALRVMKLHERSIEDWCGQMAMEHGFCPIELYVPKYHRFGDPESEYYVSDSEVKTDEEFAAETKDADYRDTTYCQFGFISGCVWGDDSSWKIRYIDLSRIADKELSIQEKFGYWEMPENLKLKECVVMNSWEPDHPWIKLTRAEHFNLETNQKA